MSTSSTDNVHARGGLSGTVKLGLDRYSSLLRSAGGEQIEALARASASSEVCTALYQAPPYDLSVAALPVSRLSINLTSSKVEGGVEDERARSFSATRYSIFLTPAGTPMKWRKEAPSRHLNIYFSPGVFDGTDTAGLPQAMLRPLFNLSFPGIRPLADQLLDELVNPSSHSTDAVDSLARLLLVYAARYAGRQGAMSRPLGAAVLTLLKDYVMANLTQRIRVADLATLAGISPSCFAMACKDKTGQSPHQFVLALRLEHACDLLRNSKLTLAEIAYDCGFASQQHLTTSMRHRLSTTPRRYRETG